MSNYLGNLIEAKNQFVKDIQEDKDFIEYKKNCNSIYGIVLSARNIFKIEEIGGNSSEMIRNFLKSINKNMPQLHETGYGRKLFEYDIPEIHKQIKRLTDCLEKIIQQNERELKNLSNDTIDKSPSKRGRPKKDLKDVVLKDWVSLAEFRDIFNYKPTQMSALLKDKTLKVATVGKRKFISKQSIQEFLEKKSKKEEKPKAEEVRYNILDWRENIVLSDVSEKEANKWLENNKPDLYTLEKI